MPDTTPATTERATFGAGCFWGVEADFRKLPGVLDATVGYAGGTTKDPTYRDVCSSRTGHAEVVDVLFDPARIGYDALLDAFWTMHDPTTLNRQGPDVGTQYRSSIMYRTPEQRDAAEAEQARLEASGTYRRPIVTEIVPIDKVYAAEDYHQRYFEKNGVHA